MYPQPFLIIYNNLLLQMTKKSPQINSHKKDNNLSILVTLGVLLSLFHFQCIFLFLYLSSKNVRKIDNTLVWYLIWICRLSCSAKYSYIKTTSRTNEQKSILHYQNFPKTINAQWKEVNPISYLCQALLLIQVCNI